MTTALYGTAGGHGASEPGSQLCRMAEVPAKATTCSQVKHEAYPTNGGMLVIFDSKSNLLQSFDPATNRITKFHEERFNHLWSFTAVAIHPFVYILCYNASVYRLDCTNKTSERKREKDFEREKKERDNQRERLRERETLRDAKRMKEYERPNWREKTRETEHERENTREETFVWDRMKNMRYIHGRRSPSVALSGSIYVIGTDEMPDHPGTVEKFDPVANEWTNLQNKPGPPTSHALVASHDIIYTIGGKDSKKRAKRSFYKFKPSSGKWRKLPRMRKARTSCSSVAVGQQIYVIGGYGDDEMKVNDVDCYDVTSRQWSLLTELKKSPKIALTYYINGFIFLFGRRDNLRCAQKYDVVRRSGWSNVEIEGAEMYNMHSGVMVFEQD